MRFELIIVQGKEAGRKYRFETDSVLLGRSEDCDVVLYDSGVSRRHARIFHHDGECCIEDMGSANGTQVNGEATRRTPLRNGDSITLGPVVCMFHSEVLTQSHGKAGASTRVVAKAQLRQLRGEGQTTPRGEGEGEQHIPLKAAEGQEGMKELPAAHREREGLMGISKILASTSKRKRMLIAGFVGIGIIAALAKPLLLGDQQIKQEEPRQLQSTPIEASFGLGETVTFTNPYEKTFEFHVAAPVPVLAVLHYQSKNIGDQEVSVTMNGVELGWLAPDTLLTEEVTHEFLAPSTIVKRNEINLVTFDNVDNPPKEDTWKVWNLWIEIVVLPEKDDANLIADAEEKFNRGQKKWQQKNIGASNRWDAYKNFREAWLTLEALPQEARPVTYALARQKMNEVREDLDFKCKQLLLEARTAYQFKQYKKADAALRHVSQFFPSRAHPCPWRAELERYELDL